MKKNVSKLLIILLFSTVYSLAIAADDLPPHSARFPGATSELFSPNGKMAVINNDPDENHNSHTLSISNNHSINQKENPIHKYNRHVLVEWSPDGKYLSITDFQESTNTTCFLYDILSATKIDLVEEAMQADKSIAHHLKNEHAYLQCSKWLSPSRVLLKLTAWGSNNPKGVEKYYKYSIGMGFTKEK